MMHGRTPFFDKNRKLMFYRIINTEVSFPPTFSPAACDCIRGLLRVNETERLGSGPTGAQEIMKTAFFSTIDFKVSCGGLCCAVCPWRFDQLSLPLCVPIPIGRLCTAARSSLPSPRRW